METELFKFNLNQINYILGQIERRERSAPPVTMLLNPELQKKFSYFSFHYPSNDPAIFADGTTLAKIKILANADVLAQFKRNLEECKSILESSPQIKDLIVYFDLPGQRDTQLFEEFIPPRASDESVQLTITNRKETKYIFYLWHPSSVTPGSTVMSDRIDLIYQLTIYTQYPSDFDRDAAIKEINEESLDLIVQGINNQIFDNSLYFPNIDEFIYLYLLIYFTQLKFLDYRKIIGKEVVPIDFETFLNKHPQLAINYMKKDLYYYPEFSEILIKRPEYYPELYELGEDFIESLKSENADVYFDINQVSKLVYYNQARIILSKPDQLTSDERKVVLEYLLLADDYEEAKRLRTRLAWEWSGYLLGQLPFEINFDIETILNLLELIRKFKNK